MALHILFVLTSNFNNICFVHKFICFATLPNRDKILSYVDSTRVSFQEGWITFNVTDPMITWITFPHNNLGLYLRIRTETIGISFCLLHNPIAKLLKINIKIALLT